MTNQCVNIHSLYMKAHSTFAAGAAARAGFTSCSSDRLRTRRRSIQTKTREHRHHAAQTYRSRPGQEPAMGASTQQRQKWVRQRAQQRNLLRRTYNVLVRIEVAVHGGRDQTHLGVSLIPTTTPITAQTTDMSCDGARKSQHGTKACLDERVDAFGAAHDVEERDVVLGHAGLDQLLESHPHTETRSE